MSASAAEPESSDASARLLQGRADAAAHHRDGARHVRRTRLRQDHDARDRHRSRCVRWQRVLLLQVQRAPHPGLLRAGDHPSRRVDPAACERQGDPGRADRGGAARLARHRRALPRVRGPVLPERGRPLQPAEPLLGGLRREPRPRHRALPGGPGGLEDQGAEGHGGHPARDAVAAPDGRGPVLGVRRLAGPGAVPRTGPAHRAARGPRRRTLASEDPAALGEAGRGARAGTSSSPASPDSPRRRDDRSRRPQ